MPAVKCETLSSGVASFIEPYKDLLFGVRWLLSPAILAALSLVIANAISISVRERRTEMAVLKVLGFTPLQLLLLVLSEAALDRRFERLGERDAGLVRGQPRGGEASRCRSCFSISGSTTRRRGGACGSGRPRPWSAASRRPGRPGRSRWLRRCFPRWQRREREKQPSCPMNSLLVKPILFAALLGLLLAFGAFLLFALRACH